MTKENSASESKDGMALFMQDASLNKSNPNEHQPHAGRLLPCPFCGKLPKIDIHPEWIDGPGFVVVRCSDCGISKEKNTETEGVAWWNTRANAETRPSCSSESTPPAVFADPTRIALDHALMALKAMLVAVKNEPAMQGRKYVTLGIQVNDAIDKCHAAMLSSSPSMRGSEKT